MRAFATTAVGLLVCLAAVANMVWIDSLAFAIATLVVAIVNLVVQWRTRPWAS
jgi:hypothetical protein